MREYLDPWSSGVDHNHIHPVFQNLVKTTKTTTTTKPSLTVIDLIFPDLVKLHTGSFPVSESSQNFTEEKGPHVDFFV